MIAAKTLVGIAHYLATQKPDALAVVSIKSESLPKKFTFGEYFRRAAGYARCFHDAGLKHGELVVLILPPGPEVMFAFWGALLVGAVPSLFPSPTEKRDVEGYGNMIRAMANVSRPVMMATNPDFYGTLQQIAAGIESLRGVAALPEDCEDDPMRWIAAYQGKEDEIAFFQHS